MNRKWSEDHKGHPNESGLPLGSSLGCSFRMISKQDCPTNSLNSPSGMPRGYYNGWGGGGGYCAKKVKPEKRCSTCVEKRKTVSQTEVPLDTAEHKSVSKPALKTPPGLRGRRCNHVGSGPHRHTAPVIRSAKPERTRRGTLVPSAGVY